MTPKIEKIIVKYLTNSATASDLDMLLEWIEKPFNKELFKEYVKIHFVINYSMNDPETSIAIERLLTAIRREKSLVLRIKKQPIYKYVAAASVLLIVALTVFLNRTDVTTGIEQPAIVDTNTIVPGTDKATLTLEDGSQIALEKGASYQMPNANSNGEQIIYEAGYRKTKDPVYNYITIPRGGQFQIILSDGTKVWLNSETQLKYPASFVDGQERRVELVYGEAYFDVTPSTENKGSKFVVLNKSQEVEVLGTEFNIKAYKDENNIYTTLVEGKVVVGCYGKRENLTPSFQSILNVSSKKVSISRVDVKSEISWKDGIFSFRYKPLKDIMKVISRWYDVEVVFGNQELESLRFRGTLDKSQSIEDILSIMKSSTINNYEIKGKTILIK